MSSLNRRSDPTRAELRTVDAQPSFFFFRRTSPFFSRTSPFFRRTSPSRGTTSSPASGSKSFRRRVVAFALAVAIGLAVASPAFADRYDKHRAGFPLRIVAYVIYPIGALLDVLIMRPAHWLVSQEPFKSAMGHED